MATFVLLTQTFASSLARKKKVSAPQHHAISRHLPPRPCLPPSQHPLTASDESRPRDDPAGDVVSMLGARMSLLLRPKRPRVLSPWALPNSVLSGLPQRRCKTVDPLAEELPFERYPRGWTPPRSIAVLGGGLTGLVTAYRLARLLPASKITLYESSSRLGGWVDTEEIKDPQGRTILFERGARMVQLPRDGSVKFDDVPFYHLVRPPTRLPRPLFCSP